MQNTPGKIIVIAIVVVIAVVVAAWTIMNAMKGPQGHTKMTPREIMEMENRHSAQGQQAPR